MSTGTHSDHGHGGHDAHGHDSGHPESTLRGYLIGFGLSVVLTAIPFWLVMTGKLGSNDLTTIAILVLAAIQIVVHMIYFLHMTPSSEGGWTMMALIFTIVMVVITLSGSLWVMYHMNANMMPGMDPSQLP
ncbi:cytochrome o ubiquinol oxidase subunit IV [Hyphomicrobium sp. 99]|uniref:cytochrome o ubiquinol oxidase subunit IV n=1 Tax=Hyphomicrobium sp. 99 TaxID=1163419 RepID=UPI0005F8009E|nr:cytochrome o ubiquinol oxidase subunit IV [Hyphomicrobium sp. 99]